MTLGMTNGTNDFSVYIYNAVNNNYLSWGPADSAGQLVGKAYTSGHSSPAKVNIGVTTDPTKSGVVTSLSGINIGEVNSTKLGKYILKY